jgi:hypothetical protein
MEEDGIFSGSDSNWVPTDQKTITAWPFVSVYFNCYVSASSVA